MPQIHCVYALQPLVVGLSVALTFGCASSYHRAVAPVDSSRVSSKQEEPVGEENPAYIAHEWGVIVGNDVRNHNTLLYDDTMIVDKPIIYFYGDAVDSLNIRVDFESGAAREVWPPTPLGASVEWEVALRESCVPTGYPEPYDCRQIVVETDDVLQDDELVDEAFPFAIPLCESSELPLYEVTDTLFVEHGEHCVPQLFYAGDVSQTVDSVVVSEGAIDGCSLNVQIENPSDFPIHDVFALVFEPPMTDDSTTADRPVWVSQTVAVIEVDEIAAGTTYEDCVDDDIRTDIVTALAEAQAAFLGRLGTRGLTGEEVGAFQVAWGDAFFGVSIGDRLYQRAPGRTTSLIYTLDRAAYDRALTWTLEPPPTELVRVGVMYQPNATLEW